MALFASKSKRKWLWVVVPPFVVLLVAAKLMNTSPPTNRSATAPDAKDAGLRTRFYPLPLEKVEDAARQVALQLSTYGQKWRLPYTGRADDTPLQRSLDIEVPVLVFTDDLTVTIQSESPDQSRVDVTSQSRVGKGDFGENRRHILQFLAALDEELARDKA